jgi:phage FluMu protein Com
MDHHAVRVRRIMPIRFRCPFCGQLLGIARRKAGCEVRCPNCQGSVQVPSADAAEAIHLQPSAPAPKQRSTPVTLFERDDFDVLLRGSMIEPMQKRGPAVASTAPPPLSVDPMPVPAVSPPVAPPPLPSANPAPEPRGVEPLVVSAVPDGILLTSTQATLLTVGFIVLLAVAFAVGLLVGRFVL